MRSTVECDESRDAFLQVLEAFAHSGLCRVAITMRSDFYALAQQNEIFLRLKGESGHFDLLAPGPEALRRIYGWTMDHAAFWAGSLDRLERALKEDDDA